MSYGYGHDPVGMECDDCWPLRDLGGGIKMPHYKECFRCEVIRVAKEAEVQRRWKLVWAGFACYALLNAWFIGFNYGWW